MPPNNLSILPALEPPAGMDPNLLNSVANVLFCLMLCFFANRIYAKLVISRKIGWDDLTCTNAFLCSIAMYIATLWSTLLGPGKDQLNISLVQAVSGNFVTTSAIIIFISPLTLLSAKITFFIFYFQVFWILRWLRICVYIGATVTCAFYGAISTAQVVMLVPRHGESWHEHSISAESHRAQVLSLYLAAVGLGIDVALLVMPIAAVAGIQISAKRKTGVIIIFMFGILACVGSILSLYYRVLQRRSPGTTWNIMAVKLAALVEIFLGISCACLPALSMTLHHHRPALEKLHSALSSCFGRIRSRKSGDRALPGSPLSDGSHHFPAETVQGPCIHPEVELQLPRATYQPRCDMPSHQCVQTVDAKDWNKRFSNDGIYRTHGSQQQ